MAKTDAFAFLDATEQAELVRQRKVKPIELVDAAIERIERINPAINAVVTPMFEEARAVARKAPKGPLAGVPFLLKDIGAPCAGVRMTEGSAFLRHYVPDYDSELVTRLKRSGLIILGKTNVSEFGLMITTEPRFLGACRNPWNTDRSTGGSSGGSAAAVAAGLVPMAHGSDGGGSIRIPAACCGVFGLKPTRARTPAGPDYAELWGGLAVQHALTRSVRDSAALLDATAGPDIGDPYWAPPPARPFIKEVGADPGRLRIAFTTATPTGRPVHADCVMAVKEAAALCADLGHEVTEASFAVDAERITRAFVIAVSSSVAATVDGYARLTGRKPAPEYFEPVTWAMYEMGHQHSAPEYYLAVEELRRIARDIGRFFLNHDIWLTPTITEPPVPLGSFDSTPENPLEGLFRMSSIMPFTPVCNFTGQPGMSVPLFWNADGLPIGTHFVARFGDEATLFRLAAQLEAARPWARRRPPVSA
ncbi:MAG: amidase [Dehalococcoidia bacterium]|nr:amidase [Dehalococcoidia bacterium]